MQHSMKIYNPEIHDKFPALSVNQPYASKIATGEKPIEIRTKPIKFRGDLMICSTKNPVIKDMECGTTIALVELYDCKPISELTPEEWKSTQIPFEKYSKMKKGYGWFLRNPRRVIEFPVSGQQGIFNLVYDKDLIICYPTHIKI